MAVTILPAETLVKSVKHEIKTPTTCTKGTLQKLRQLLDRGNSDKGAGHHAPCKQKPKITKPKLSTHPGRAKASALNFTVLEADDAQNPTLPTSAQLQLATDVFNVSLKTLSEASKTPPQNKTVKGRPVTGDSPTKHVLHVTSPNRDCRPTLEGKQAKFIPTASTQCQPSIEIIAQCAQLALRCLQRLQKDKKEKGLSTHLQLAQAASALITKLINLEMTQIAWEELRFLRQILIEAIEIQHSVREQRQSETSSRFRPTNDASMLYFSHLPSDGPTLKIVLSFQLLVVRVAAVQPNVDVVKSLVSAVDLPQSNSPARIILESLEQRILTAETAAQQLSILSQALLTTCRIVVASESFRGSDGAKCVFELQSIALQIRLSWWRITRHQCDVQKEFWNPLVKYLSMFLRSCKHCGKNDIAACIKAVRDLETSVRTCREETRIVETPSSISNLLAQLAEDAGLFKEAIVIYEKLLAQQDAKKGLASAIQLCKIATLRLENMNEFASDLVIESLSSARSSLTGSLKGTASELDELHCSAVRLQRAISKAGIGADFIRVDDESTSCSPNQVFNGRSRTIYSILFFQLRYIGERPSENDEKSISERYTIRLNNVMKSAKSTLENVLAICRQSIDLDDPPWEESELAIDNFLVLYEKLQASEQWQRNAHNVFVRLSNLYWTRYVKLKAHGAPVKTLVAALERSTEILTARSISERQAGKITEKLDRLATALAESNRASDALSTYTTAIRTLAEFGVIDTLVEEAAQQSYQDLWSAEHVQTLQRLLCGFIRLRIRSKDISFAPLFDLETFSEVARCLFVERQIHAITSLKSSEIHDSSFLWIIKDLLNSLNASFYPIRRLRVLHHVLDFASKEPHLLPEAFLKEIRGEITKLSLDEKALGHDKGLARFLTYLVTSTQLLSALTLSRPSFDHCYHAVKSWEVFIESCQTWICTKSRIEDIQAFYRLLETLYDFAEMQGYSGLSVDILQVMIRYLDLQPQKDHSALSSCLSQLGLQLTRAGFSKMAGHVFAQAKHHLEKAESKTTISLQWNLAYAEYLIDISNLETSSEILVSAQWLYDTDFPSELEAPNLRRSRFAQDKFLSQAAYVASRLAVEQQDAYAALKSAKQCVKLTSRIWLGLEKVAGIIRAEKRLESHDTESSDVELDSVSQELNELSLSAKSQSFVPRSTFGPAFWPYVSLHYRGLMQMSIVSAQNRLFQDSIHYSEQAKYVANATSAIHRQATVEALLSNYWAMGGYRKESEQQYEACSINAKSLHPSLDMAHIQMRLAQVGLTSTISSDIFCGDRELQNPRQLLLCVSDMLQQLKFLPNRSSLAALDSKETASKQLSGKRSVAENKRIMSRRIGKSTQPPQRRPNQPLQVKVSESTTQDVPNSLPIARCVQDVKFLNARFLMKDGNMQEAGLGFQEQNVSLLNHERRLISSVLFAKTLLARAKAALAKDAVYCVLPESSVAFPAVIGKKGQRHDLSIETMERDPTINRLKKTSQKAKSSDNVGNARVLLHEARNRLTEVCRSVSHVVDLDTFSALCSAWSEMTMLSSVLNFNIESGSTALFSLSCLDRVRQTSREKLTNSLDKHFEDRARLIDWPSDQIQEGCLGEGDDESSVLDTVVSTLPSDWDVVSVQLGNNNTELLLSKLRRDQTPFTLRLPLRRSSADGTDDLNGELDFSACRKEMLNIIDQANSTSHDSQAWEGKERKKEWWATREALDERLRFLLENIENVWFGGFRGIFSPQARRPDLLARFSRSFQQILDNNLPSRRKPNTIEKECPGLHPHVLDLFVSLGDPAEMDLDDSVTDLLYFVVDILQFHGERNAYDEIDLDLIVVQTIDALRAYHEACNALADESVRHTILILDKSLHVFPWESLPSLQGQSISRLPSLLSLRDRISVIHSMDGSAASLKIDRESGSYILNPSSDLKGTEETFASHFSHFLTSYTSIIDRIPTEAEFKSCLTDTSLCLYFGHGSGAQYIRGRTIRRLEKCAVTFLMGCSSSKLVDCGEFEPYGVPWNYMHAGAPALVGTLWDVTDKDIDRFAMRMLDNWGLLNGINTKEEAKTPGRLGRSRSKASGQTKGGRKAAKNKGTQDCICLDEAVSKGRDACVLRYLNGAAPVIYGIPVSLTD